MTEKDGVNPELTYAWAQETLAKHEANGGERPFQLLRVNTVGDHVEAIVEVPDHGGEPYRRSASVPVSDSRTPEFVAFQAVAAALVDDYPQAADVASAIQDVRNSGFLAGDEVELFLIPAEDNNRLAYNSYGRGENATRVALEEGVASLLLEHQK